MTSDGSYQHEGMKNVMGKLWDKVSDTRCPLHESCSLSIFLFDKLFHLQKRVRLACAALSLPYPSGITAVGKDTTPKSVDQKLLNKILLVGCDQSGTSAIFKQVISRSCLISNSQTKSI